MKEKLQIAISPKDMENIDIGPDGKMRSANPVIQKILNEVEDNKQHGRPSAEYQRFHARVSNFYNHLKSTPCLKCDKANYLPAGKQVLMVNQEKKQYEDVMEAYCPNCGHRREFRFLADHLSQPLETMPHGSIVSGYTSPDYIGPEKKMS